MKLSNLNRLGIKNKSKRVGRGESSGKGKTSGRGMKGQKSRNKVRVEFEGGQLPIIKRLPFQRGVGNKSLRKSITITLSQLDKFNSKEIINLEALQKAKIIVSGKKPFVKVVATGKLTKPLTVNLPTTKKAKKIIESLKGKVEEKP